MPVADAVKSRFYVTVQLGPNRHKNDAGYLVCTDVPICRLGIQLYGPHETPIEGIGNRPVKIHRLAEDVFAPDCIASANGAPVVDDHPSSREVNVKSHGYLAKGLAMNARRGTGANEDVMLADLWIWDEEMIKILDTDEKREVSCGYDAEYEEIAPGEGKQVLIIINHVAVVDSGRCGSRCSIGDSLPKRQKGTRMKVLDFKNKVLAALGGVTIPAVKKVLDEMDPDAMLDDAPSRNVDNQIHIHNADHSARLDDHEKRIADCEGFMNERKAADKKAADEALAGGLIKPPGTGDSAEEKEKKDAADKAMKDAEEKKEIEGELKEEAPEGTGDADITKANDSALLNESFQETVAMAEIIAPGVRLPTMDAAAKPKSTMDSICDLRRRALDEGLKDGEVLAMVKAVRGRTLDAATLAKLHCRDVRHIFRSVGALVAASNIGSLPTPTLDTNNGQGVAKQLTAAEINKRNALYYSK